jgi:hypothetical protein
VLFTTGYGSNGAKNEDRERHRHLIRKPYRSNELAAKLREVIEGA